MDNNDWIGYLLWQQTHINGEAKNTFVFVSKGF